MGPERFLYKALKRQEFTILGFGEQRESPVLRRRERLREAERGSQDQRMPLWLTLNEIWKSKMEIPAKLVTFLAQGGAAVQRAVIAIVLLFSATPLAPCWQVDTPKFEAADVRASARTNNLFPSMRNSGVHDGRLEVKTATMVDLVQLAYGFTPDKILGGPSWLELDRFDVIAKVPPDTTPETLKPMLHRRRLPRLNAERASTPRQGPYSFTHSIP
jgi:hypothetical protein